MADGRATRGRRAAGPQGDGKRAAGTTGTGRGEGAGGLVSQEKSQLRERAEAIHAANVALRHLERSAELLDSARDWGSFDMFIGGMVASMIKHKRIDDAEDEFNAARAAVRRFARELSDVEGVDPIRLDVNGLVSGIDIFLDNVFVDIYVQVKIDKAQRRVAEAIAQIQAIRKVLYQV